MNRGARAAVLGALAAVCGLWAALGAVTLAGLRAAVRAVD